MDTTIDNKVYESVNNIIAEIKKSGYEIKWGAELEFYASNFDVGLSFIKNERGKNQFEIVSPVFTEYQGLERFLAQSKQKVLEITSERADFSAKPFLDDYGSALQVSFSLINAQKESVLDKGDIDNNIIGQRIISTLLKQMKTVIKTICKEQDLSRFCGNYMAPTHISWGGTNNRTTAIRFVHTKPRRIEYRIPPASANLLEVIYFITQAIKEGIKNKDYEPVPRIWGNAYDKQYALEAIVNKL